MSDSRHMLPNSMALAWALLKHPSVAMAFDIGDPLRLNLPPLGDGHLLDADALRVMATLYFQAELEQAGVIPVAEVLADARYSLRLEDTEAARLLETFADGMHDQWYPREQREQIFARTFGIGAGAVQNEAYLINRDFQSRMAQVCISLQRFQEASAQAVSGSPRTAGIEMAMGNLTDNLARQRFGNTLIAANRIQTQLQAALTLLNHTSLTRLFQARSIWELIRNILGGDAPDLRRLIDRSQTGLQLLGWMAEHLEAIQNSALLLQAFSADPGIFSWAAVWLAASGFGETGSDMMNSRQGGAGYVGGQASSHSPSYYGQ